MCGICGIIGTQDTSPVRLQTLLAMQESLNHRGPDDRGYRLEDNAGLASTRLAILDLSERGHMPMSSDDGRYWIVYNGEIYNYQELRGALAAKGARFRSNTDTEVALRLYEAEGPAMLARLNGMFAIAIWDSVERELFLGRDRLGVKPLYYWRDAEGKLYFASEEKALFIADAPCELDADAWEELLCFRYVAGENTPFMGIKRLLPGHYLTWKGGRCQTVRWWRLDERARELREQAKERDDFSFKDIFDSAVDLRRISDVPLGVLLSGGLDSSSVAASLALQAGSGIASFTVRFQEAAFDEGDLAKQVAGKWGLAFHELFVGEEDLLGGLRQASWLNDEPLVHGNDLHLLRIAQYAKPLVTVLLSGEGGDETLGGYVRYRPLMYPRLSGAGRYFAQALERLPQPRLRKLGRFLELGSLDRFVFYNSCDVLPADLMRLGLQRNATHAFRELILQEAKDTYPGEPVRQAMYYDQHTFLCSILDRNDRMTMGASIECRVPFLDYRLVERLAAEPSSRLFKGRAPKSLLRSAVGSRLPEAILTHRKWGFGVPWERYLREIPELRLLVEELPRRKPIDSGPLNEALLKQEASRFLEGDNAPFALIKQLVMIAIWHEAYVEPMRSMNGRANGERHA